MTDSQGGFAGEKHYCFGMTEAMQREERRMDQEARQRFDAVLEAVKQPYERLLKLQEEEIKRLTVENERLKGELDEAL
jgi:hypothetical protein